MSFDKKTLRKKMIEARNNLSGSEVSKKSLEINRRLAETGIFKNSSCVMLYRSFRNEVSTDYLFRLCREAGKRTLFPVTDTGKGVIIPFEARDIEKDFIKSTFGIWEPDPGKLRPADPLLIDLVVVPGVVFDTNCNRIGYGAGYYDRFLAALNARTVKAGIAFDFQVVDNLPSLPHDVKLDMVVTESRIITAE